MKRGGLFLILFSIFLAIVIIISFYFLIHKPNKLELAQLMSRIGTIETTILQQEGSIASSKKEIATMDLGGINLNYLNRNNIEKKDQVTFFLKIINEQANKYGIQIISINPNPPEHKKNYLKESFDITFKTNFRCLVTFLNDLQNTFGLNTDGITIATAENEKYPEIIVKMLINSLEISSPKEQNIKTLEELRDFYIENDPIFNDIKKDEVQKIDKSPYTMFSKSYRDPFVKPEHIKKIQKEFAKLEQELAVSKLQGIIDFDGQKRAIIGHHTVKKGDPIFNMYVVDITSDTVTLGNKELRFIYKIKKNNEDQNINKES